MKTYFAAYLFTLVAFLVIDFIWLSTMASRLYRPAIGDLLAENFRLAPAVVFYLIYAAGLTFLAVRPAFQTGEWTTALLYGAVVGFMAYATYDLTNQATLKSWSTTLTVADLLWGTFVSAAAATIGYLITVRLIGPLENPTGL
ncbi:hypothetical protein H009_06362 [Agrobacterium tumefaciens str. Cherry 2E-2-2]|jgi:uncharacterized membrane protein|uniref:DUF2177 family protein n=2 Tax=Agrobacterium TaxID=357 RepID=A0AAE6BRU4_AGRTU|nr:MULTISPECIES: DUF2177 family protein [Rhizobium/Agrobacterium group]EMS98598.1 hypothetical protein H009_06362 [Agrobacterium tumefaciens str. Cherry 2E-2-2]MCA2371012.1 DUF2177 family protein [Agrobacterium tomkonis CIP 111-78]MCZ7454411.1 DUF2177 family protein [Rhizobium rhizogenes]MCZ7911590.1 DUF2177 family protein [Agrobacterium leguminum]QCM02459.1 DUF2177 family protein [Agrobacterium tumefaciens]